MTPDPLPVGGSDNVVPLRRVANDVRPLFRPFPATGDDDYRGRMRANAAAFALCVILVTAGVWLMVEIASLPQHLDCNFSRHRPCHTTANLK
jgi:hypothetical protein